ncbi:MAG: 4-phosphoerythronate dehydrogenase PdxB [Candidatus Hydrogenedentes bacterium]|nr:4-phosphoerythronate dehydrogenase PdxB [Candidatus Hydrogenedentota bacterium]
MYIVADENIPFVAEGFAGLGEVRTMPGRDMGPADVRDADILLVRSITKVGKPLLDGSKVRFVATATIGEDHIDRSYLASRDIGFSSAPGSNANSVSEYVAAALLNLACKFGFSLKGKTLGIIGVGNVGSRVLDKARALGMRCVLNDPPLARRTADERYKSIDEILNCDIVTVHVPLTTDGLNPTRHLVDDKFLADIRSGAILINTSRGSVADGESIKRALDVGRLGGCVLDVWENEPAIDPELVNRTDIGTPHIAGYSFDGKVNGTRMIYEAACSFFGIEPVWNSAKLMPEPECTEITVAADTASDEHIMNETVRRVYDITRDDTALRKTMGMPIDTRAAAFDMLRKQYPRRREFYNTRVVVSPPNTELERKLSGLGFQTQPV